MGWATSAKRLAWGCRGAEASIPCRKCPVGDCRGLVLAGVQQKIGDLQRQLFPQRVLLDLDDRGLRGLTLQAGRRPRVGSLWQASFPEGLCRQGRPQQVTALGDFIGDLILEQGLVAPRLAASLPAAACVTRVIAWPFGELPEEPRQALRQIDPDLRLPFPLQDAYLDLWTLPGQPLRSLLVATPQVVLESWIQVFSIAELALDRLEPAQGSEWRCLQAICSTADASELTVVLALEREVTRLLLVQRGMPVFECNLPAVGVPFQANEVGDLIVAVDRCRRFWQRQRSGGIASVRWLLHGPRAAQTALVMALEQAGVDQVDVIDPLQRRWLALPAGMPAAPEGLEPPALLRLSGLLQAEVIA